ncbi:hypothetical protein FF1_040127 [Malus domestica]
MEDLVVHLEESLEITPMENGVKLVGMVLNEKPLNKWGVRNILRAAWKDIGEMQVKWVKDNLYIIIVPDENSARQILSQVPWTVMKKNFSVKRWSQDLALEEIQWDLVPFWVQIRGVPLCLCSPSNLTKLASAIGQVEEVENPSLARGFLRAKVIVDTSKPLLTGCWLPRKQNQETWLEFRYERLQDFCYKCGRIGHTNMDCSFEQHRGGGNGYGDWLKATPIQEIIDRPRSKYSNPSGRRTVGTKRSMVGGGGWQRVRDTATQSGEAQVVSKEGLSRMEEARGPNNVQISRLTEGSRVVDLTLGSCQWALADHLPEFHDQLGRAFNLLGPQPSRSLDFHIPLELSLSVELVQIEEGPYEGNGRPADGLRLAQDEVAQAVAHLKPTSGKKNKKRLLELKQLESGLSATKKIKKGDGGIPRQMKARFRNIFVPSGSVVGESDSLEVGNWS